MEIVDYDLFEVPPRWLFVRLETNDGTVGWGEHVTGAGGPPTIHTAAEALIHRYVINEDPHRIEDIWQRMYRGGFYRGGPVLMSAMAGIDQALWDIKGKELDVPIFELLGGRVRDRMPVYQWIGGDRPAEVRDEARAKVDAGFTAMKMNATEEMRRIEPRTVLQKACERLEAVREEVGDSIDIAVDFHGRVPKSMAKRLVKELEPYDPMFIEEPVLPDHNDALREIVRHTTTPIATGERLFTRMDFKEVLEDGVVDVIQPDLSHAGGITEVSKIAAMAEAYDVALAPHCPLGPIALAACLQVDATVHNALIQEQSLNIHYNQDADLYDYLEDPSVFDYDDGYVTIPDGPGLGIEINEEEVRKRASEPTSWEDKMGFYKEVWRHDDGSVAEW